MKKIISVLIFVLTFTLTACSSVMTENRPDDFSFSLVWNTYGISYYNSASGSLVKTTDATNPEDYITSLRLTSEQLDAIYTKIAALNMEKYPDKYDPFNNMMSEPSQTIILTCGDKSIACERICLGYESDNKKGQNFLDTVKFIVDILTSTEEWQALPEYEFYYD